MKSAPRVLPLLAVLAALFAGAGCKKAADVPESGALLLRITTPSQGPQPDELRVWVYDDRGPLFRNARFPSQGALPAASAEGVLGTILLQPGASMGALRIHVRGLRAAVRLADGLLVIPAGTRGAGTVTVSLATAVPSDGDLDDVPDAIDDCPTVADPDQAGCPDGSTGGDLDGGSMDRNAPGNDAGEETDAAGDDAEAGSAIDTAPPMDAPGGNDAPSPDALGSDAATADGRPADTTATDASANDGAARDSTTTEAGAGDGARLQTGAACGAGTECQSGFCADGMCCLTACDQPCQRCILGVCTLVRNATDVPECPTGMTCNGAGLCR